MELIISFSFLACLFLLACFHSRPVRRRPNLPPGPRPLPIIGNIHQLGRNTHHSLAKLSKIHGPLMYLKLGTVDAVVVSSSEHAKQVLQKHDQLLSSRFQHAVTDIDGHNRMSVVWLPPGPHWRDLRRLLKDQMFSAQRLDASEGVRSEKVKSLRDFVQDCCDGSRAVDIADAAFVTSMNLTSATMFSMDFGRFDSERSREFKEIVHGFMRVLGTPNIADFFPVLKGVDPQGLMRRAKLYSIKVRRIFDDIIDKRLMDSVPKNDLLETLLVMNRRNEFTREQIIHLLLDLFVGGIDTSAATEEWAMSELIRNPKEMAKVKNELRRVIGEKGKPVEESDISKLPYLQAVLKETLRLHPAGPLLVPHKAEADTEIDSYIVPKNAQILVNIYAICRDSSRWPNPDSFEPQRFLESKVDVKGQDFELIPFGSGRRICPGMPLAHRMVHLVVATLVHNFDWKLEGGIKMQDLDMKEKFEFSLKKAVPLRAVPLKL